MTRTSVLSSNARLRNFTTSGHSPMWDAPGRFDREIGHFVGHVTATEDKETLANREANQRYARR